MYGAGDSPIYGPFLTRLGVFENRGRDSLPAALDHLAEPTLQPASEESVVDVGRRLHGARMPFRWTSEPFPHPVLTFTSKDLPSGQHRFERVDAAGAVAVVIAGLAQVVGEHCEDIGALRLFRCEQGSQDAE